MKPEQHPLIKAWIEFAMTNHFCHQCTYPWLDEECTGDNCGIHNLDIDTFWATDDIVYGLIQIANAILAGKI